MKKIKSRVGDGKLKRDIDDILNVYTVLDGRKAVLPRLLAADVSRVPTFTDLELTKLTMSINEAASDINMSVASQIAQLTTQINASIATKLDDLCTRMKGHIDGGNSMTSSMFADLSKEVSSSALQIGLSVADQNKVIQEVKTSVSGLVSLPVATKNASSVNKASDASSAAQAADGNTTWSTIVRGRAIPSGTEPPGGVGSPQNQLSQTRRKIVGSNKQGGGKIASSSGGQWHVFIGRLDKDTTESDMKEFLDDVGVEVVSIYKLKATQPWQDKSAAFRVSVALKCKDSIMCPDLWPDHIEVRDWVFKPK